MATLADVTVGFIGAGSMGGAIARGLVATGTLPGERILACDPYAPLLEPLADDFGIRTFTDAAELLAAKPDVVVLAVKPQVQPSVLAEHAAALAHSLVVSIAAGVPIATIEAALPGAHVVRVMPNLPVSVRLGASAVTGGSLATADEVELVRGLFAAVGSAQVMREDQLDVDGASVGTAPAYFALFVDTLTRASIKAGLPAAAARDMLLTTMEGVAHELRATGEHPRAYVERVTSPGGTTACGLYELEPLLLEGSYAAVDAALRRTDELAGR